MAEYYSIVWMDHVFFIHLTLDGHWVVSIFWLLVIMLLWTSVYTFLLEHLFSDLWAIHPGAELLGSMVTLCFTHWRTARLFSTSAVPFYTPTGNVQRFQLLHTLTDTCYFLRFSFSHDMGMEASIPLYKSTNQSLCSSVDGHLGCFWLGLLQTTVLWTLSHMTAWLVCLHSTFCPIPFPFGKIFPTLSHPSCLMGSSEAVLRASKHPSLRPTLSNSAATNFTWL